MNVLGRISHRKKKLSNVRRRTKLLRPRSKQTQSNNRKLGSFRAFCVCFAGCFLIYQQYQYADLDGLDVSILSDLVVGSSLAHQNERVTTALKGTTAKRDDTNNNKGVSGQESFDPPQCSAGQLEILSKQIGPMLCERSKKMPYMNRCSFSWASQCPDTPWVGRHLAKAKTTTEDSFLSFFVGCNKAIDAVNALQLGSRNPKYDVAKWKESLKKAGDFAGSSCKQLDGKDYTLKDPTQPHRLAQVYCFEPVTSTFTQLQRTKTEMGWTNELVLEQAAMSSEAGSMSVSTSIELGKEDSTLEELTCSKNHQGCQEIPIYTLNDYVATSLSGTPPIHFLSIDVEGYDFEVLKGASNILPRVHYLEFEYSWKEPWGKQNLADAIQMLHDVGFICYFPGDKKERIWRITGCWQEHYALHFWSNIACVNGNIPEARPLADDMEEHFLETLADEHCAYAVGKGVELPLYNPRHKKE